MFRSRSAVIRLLLPAALALAAVTAPSAAHAWWRGGIYFGLPPVVVAPSPYYYPPAYYAPPAVYAPPPVYAPAAGQACYAGPYVCPLEGPAAAGAPCSCPTNNGRAGGRAG
jgi:hypothetical protein